MTMSTSDVITNITKTKHERHGVDIQCLTKCEALERQKQKLSANQNNLDTKMFLTFELRKCIPTLDSLVQKQRS